MSELLPTWHYIQNTKVCLFTVLSSVTRFTSEKGEKEKKDSYTLLPFSFGKRADTYCLGCSVLFWGHWLKNKREKKALTHAVHFLIPLEGSARPARSLLSQALTPGKLWPPHQPRSRPCSRPDKRPPPVPPALTEGHH